jgi:squalene-hopene/tetraprenyl-beta-curcumene cyclase
MRIAFIVLLTFMLAPLASAQTTQSTDTLAQAQTLIDKGLAYLQSQQKPDGGWQAENKPPAVTAIVLRVFVQEQPKYTSKTDFIKRGYDKLLSYQLESGGIYKDLLANYNTAIAISSLAAAKDPAFKERIDRATNYLKGLQWNENITGPKGERVDQANAFYGGFGYGRKGRPDLSNTHFAIEALHDAGLKQDDPAFKAAVLFLSRTQNSSATNDLPWAMDDGGFVYTPASEGDSEAGTFVDDAGRKRARSYGSMTYAGIKSMIYAGLTRDDLRVQSAFDWITNNWTLDINPGMQLANPAQAQHGLYYYYNVFAQALNVMDQPIITDAKGTKHEWRTELVQKLASLQKPDGSWVGETRWMEDDPILVTAYAVLALQQVKDDLMNSPGKPGAK